MVAEINRPTSEVVYFVILSILSPGHKAVNCDKVASVKARKRVFLEKRVLIDQELGTEPESAKASPLLNFVMQGITHHCALTPNCKFRHMNQG